MENKDLYARKEGQRISTITEFQNKHKTNQTHQPKQNQTIKQLWVLHKTIGQKKQMCTAWTLNAGVQGGLKCGSCYSLDYEGRQTEQSTNSHPHPLLVL